ncbi:MAG TPA: hypothetical protein VF678_12820 [bacterium]
MRQFVSFLFATLALLLLIALPAFAEDKPLMDYGVDLVTDYVSRGEDIYVRRFDKEQEKHTAVNMAPALQPSVTFFAPNGLSLNLWGSFALSNRADDNAKGFLGLGRDDELDYTLAFDWSNRLGGFTAGVIVYSYFDACRRSPTGACNRNTPDPDPVPVDALFRWAMPFAASAHPTFAYYANQTPGASYTTLGVSGGETFIWAATVGMVAAGAAGVTDLTAKLGVVLGDFKVSLDGAYRPNPELIGPYDKDGHYLVKGKQETYPSTVLWMTLSYTGSVAAK